MEIYFYQNMICPHAAPFLKELANIKDINLIWVVDCDVLPYRSQMGISLPDFGNAKIIQTQDARKIRDIVSQSAADSIHVLSGLRSAFCSKIALRQAIKEGKRTGFYNEPGNHLGIKGLLRRCLYIYEYLAWGRKIDFILPTGQLGIDWFSNAGYPHSKLFPFCYVTEDKSGTVKESTQNNMKFQILYCGQLIHRKNVEVLFKALKAIEESSWECSIVGDGPLSESLRQKALEAGFADRVKWLGVASNDSTINHMAQSDLLILPSRFDGWGAVVNESLSVGTPVICSDNCGAGEFLQDAWRGNVFKSNSSGQLAKLIENRIKKAKLSFDDRLRISEWTRDTASGVPVANYFLEIINHVYNKMPRPVPPWRK
jgi:glycosyltransferase involved in cell wall biosynthesis